MSNQAGVCYFCPNATSNKGELTMNDFATCGMTEEEVYRAFQEYLDKFGFGYCAVEGGHEMAMLKEFYTPQEALWCMDMPRNDFFDVQWFAQTEGMDEAQAEETLRALAVKGDIYREKTEDGYRYHMEPAAHGIYEFHAGDAMNANWISGLYGTMAGGMLAQVYDAGIPFYRCVPAKEELVKPGELEADDNLFEMLKTHRRFCVSPCACLQSSRDIMGIHNCNHDGNVCIQTDEMADYYLDDLKLGREITLEEAEAILRRNIDEGLAMQTTFAKKNEIICSCKVCHCGILQAAKMFPGDAMNNISRYEIEFDADKCIHDGGCAARCSMGAITIGDDGLPTTDASCIGCGQCVIACKPGARVLTHKKPEGLQPLPDVVWDAYAVMEGNRRSKGMIE